MMSGSTFVGLIVVLFVLQMIVPGTWKNQEVFASPVVSESSRHDLSDPLRSITPRVPMVYEGDHQRDYIFERPSYRRGLPGRKAPSTDLGLQDWEGAGQMPGPILNFQGISASEVLAGNGYTPYPPDPNGDVGPDHYVQWVNVSFAIWDKTGKRVYGPAAGNTLWSGFGGPC